MLLDEFVIVHVMQFAGGSFIHDNGGMWVNLQHGGRTGRAQGAFHQLRYCMSFMLTRSDEQLLPGALNGAESLSHHVDWDFF